ncbi:MAG: hypothetical protein H0Z40_01725 [Desulfotomaculum sp.]|nr:hypothetical protein [Desulfotomaculum sp.]
MYCSLIPGAFSVLLAFSRNTKNEKTMIFATLEDNPKIYMLNLYDNSIQAIGRIIQN